MIDDIWPLLDCLHEQFGFQVPDGRALGRRHQTGFHLVMALEHELHARRGAVSRVCLLPSLERDAEERLPRRRHYDVTHAISLLSVAITS
ncbi:hypothetical protein [Nonomuraea sp. NPDC003754]